MHSCHPPTEPIQEQNDWFFLIRFMESMPVINLFYGLWLVEAPPKPEDVTELLRMLAVVDTFLLAVIATFASAVSFDELTEADDRFTVPGFNDAKVSLNNDDQNVATFNNIPYNSSIYYRYSLSQIGGYRIATIPMNAFAPSPVLNAYIITGFTVLFMSLVCVVYTQVDMIGNKFDPFPGGIDNPDNQVIFTSWWRFSKWIILFGLMSFFVGVSFCFITILEILLVKFPFSTLCPTLSTSYFDLSRVYCVVSFRITIVFLFVVVSVTLICLLNGLATANRHRVYRLLKAKKDAEARGCLPVTSSNTCVSGPDTGCLPWACPSFQPYAEDNVTAVRVGTNCCDDNNVINNIYDPAMSATSFNDNSGIKTNGGPSVSYNLSSATTATTSMPLNNDEQIAHSVRQLLQLLNQQQQQQQPQQPPPPPPQQQATVIANISSYHNSNTSRPVIHPEHHTVRGSWG